MKRKKPTKLRYVPITENFEFEVVCRVWSGAYLCFDKRFGSIEEAEMFIVDNFSGLTYGLWFVRQVRQEDRLD